MSARTSKTIPRAIEDFLAAVDGVHVPSDVHVVLSAVRDAIFSPEPVPALNRSLGQLKRQHPETITSLEAWLKSAAIIELASSSGCHWARVKWCSACEALKHGEKAHVAFGMNLPGRRPSTEFGEYEDAAIVAESRRQYIRSEIATESVLTRPDGSQLDRREVQRQRKLLQERGFTSEEIREQARLINIKHRKA